MTTPPSPTTQWGAPYITLHGSEWRGIHGAMGVRVQIAGTTLPDLEASPIWNTAHDAVEKVYAEAMAAVRAARADNLVRTAINLLHTDSSDPHYKAAIIDALTQASGALGFAGNSQTRLINACDGVIRASNHEVIIAGKYKRTEGEEVIKAVLEAVEHAEGPGID